MSGVFGIETNFPCWDKITDAAGILQPRGDEWTGISAIQEGMILREAQRGKITPLMEQEGPKFKGSRTVIVHVNQSPQNPQPAKIEQTNMGPIAVAFDGKIINLEELKRKSPYLVGSEVSIIARFIAAGKDPVDGILNVFKNVKGPFSLVLLTRDGLFAARDVLGIRPFVSGTIVGKEKNGCAVASESACLKHVDMNVIRDIKPGEIVSIDSFGTNVLHQGISNLNICSFEYAYWARITSIIEDVWVGEVRREAGRRLAQSCPEVDFVSSFPMSGNASAEGLQQSLGIGFQTIFEYNAEAGGRSFLPFSSELRAKRARNKLILAEWAVKNKRMIIVDDSIVEGNQTKARVSAIWEAGAKEIHLRIETPMIKFPCPFDVTPRGELIAAKHSLEEIRKIIGATSLAYNSIEDFAESIPFVQSERRRKENPVILKNLCLGCFTGEFPKYPDL